MFTGEIKGSNKPQDQQIATPSMFPQGYFHDKPCRYCKTVFSPRAPRNMYCQESCRKAALSERHYQSNYGVSLSDWQAMYTSQHGLCAICGSEGFTMKASHIAKLMVDHNHKTGAVRGLLCHNCNRGLGLFHDDVPTLQRAITYLL